MATRTAPGRCRTASHRGRPPGPDAAADGSFRSRSARLPGPAQTATSRTGSARAPVTGGLLAGGRPPGPPVTWHRPFLAVRPLPLLARRPPRARRRCHRPGADGGRHDRHTFMKMILSLARQGNRASPPRPVLRGSRGGPQRHRADPPRWRCGPGAARATRSAQPGHDLTGLPGSVTERGRQGARAGGPGAGPGGPSAAGAVGQRAEDSDEKADGPVVLV